MQAITVLLWLGLFHASFQDLDMVEVEMINIKVLLVIGFYILLKVLKLRNADCILMECHVECYTGCSVIAHVLLCQFLEILFEQIVFGELVVVGYMAQGLRQSNNHPVAVDNSIKMVVSILTCSNNCNALSLSSFTSKSYFFTF